MMCATEERRPTRGNAQRVTRWMAAGGLLLSTVNCHQASPRLEEGPEPMLATDAAVAPTPSGGQPLADTPLGMPTPMPAMSQMHPSTEDGRGQGACADVRLGEVAAAVRMRFSELADVVDFRPRAPQAAGEPEQTRASISGYTGWSSGQQLVVVFYRGQDECSAQGCKEERYWYFQTDASCQPMLVGRYYQRQEADCVDVEGQPLWDYPAAPMARSHCDPDPELLDLRGSYDITVVASPLLGQGGEDGRCAGVPANLTGQPATLTVDQTDNLQTGSLRFDGTGLSQLDGWVLPADFSPQRATTELHLEREAACLPTIDLRAVLDLESVGFAIPRSLAMVDLKQSADPSCEPSVQNCSFSLIMFFLPRN